MSESGRPQHSVSESRMSTSVPRKEEWSLIYQQRAMEFEQTKSLEKQLEREKKQKLKKQLDKQISSRSDQDLVEKQADRQYYNYIVSKTEEQLHREERERRDRFERRKLTEEQNMRFIQMHQQNQLNKSQDQAPSFNIGIKSEMEKKEKDQLNKKIVSTHLQKQLEMRKEVERQEKQQEREQERANQSYTFMPQENRSPRRAHHPMNEQVYHQFEAMQNQKMMRERELEIKLVREAAIKKEQQERDKLMRKEQEKQLQTKALQDTLSQQVQLYNDRRLEEHKTNPEMTTYAVLDGLFKERSPAYDKKRYSDYLRLQAEEQKRRRNEETKMTDQQYRLNYNQLHKAVNGAYPQQSYLDRSVGAIGDRQTILNNAPVKDEDVQIVKHKLEELRHQRNRSAVYNNRNNLW